jgi:glycosyltransferase involved in cell wall biosynthesis
MKFLDKFICMDNLDVIIPAYNEARTISETIRGIRKILGDGCRIIVVDDASEDATAAEVKELGEEIIQHPYRLGNGASIKSGVRKATADFVLIIDGDGQHLPEDIPNLLAHIGTFDMVIGARQFSRLTWRNLANKMYNLFASYVTRFKIEDLTSGFRVVKRRTALQYLYLFPNGFSYPTTITLAFLKTGRTIKYVPIATNPRVKGKSKIRVCRDGVKFLLIIIKIATFFSPLRVFIPVSVLFFVSGCAYYAFTYLTQHRFTNMAVFLLSNAVFIFMLGLVSEQISQLRMDKTEGNETD